MADFKVKSKTKIFPQPGGWVYVPVPNKITALFKDIADRGLIPITATVGQTTWHTSLLPMGDGTHFIALKAQVRKAEQIEVGDTAVIRFKIKNA